MKDVIVEIMEIMDGNLVQDVLDSLMEIYKLVSFGIHLAPLSLTLT